MFGCGSGGFLVCLRGVRGFLVCLRGGVLGWGGGFGCESVLVVSDAHVSGLFLFSWFCSCLVCLVNNGLSWVWCFGARGFGVRVWCGWWLLGLCAGGCGFCLCGWCGGGLARVFCREWFVGLGVRAGWWLARVFAVCVWVFLLGLCWCYWVVVLVCWPRVWVLRASVGFVLVCEGV